MMAEDDPRLGGRNYPAYEADYAAWLAAQVDLLRAGRLEELDLINLLSEVEGLGISNFKAFASAIEVVLVHLLKWDVQTEKRSRSWATSIKGHRERVLDDLGDSPSYRSRGDEAVHRAYKHARYLASKETKLPLTRFPEECPYDWDDIMTRPIRFDAQPDPLV